MTAWRVELLFDYRNNLQTPMMSDTATMEHVGGRLFCIDVASGYGSVTSCHYLYSVPVPNFFLLKSSEGIYLL